ncbi:hypothetical protein GCM10028800_21410 [Nesterenkonia populi]
MRIQRADIPVRTPRNLRSGFSANHVLPDVEAIALQSITSRVVGEQLTQLFPDPKVRAHFPKERFGSNEHCGGQSK